MLKRVAAETEVKNTSESPQKKPTLPQQSSPKKEYPYYITVRKIVDPESNELLAVTLENTYPILSWIKGLEQIHGLYIPAQGKHVNFHMFKCLIHFELGRFAPRPDIQARLDQAHITSTCDFLIATDRRSVKEQPLWIFLAGPDLNSLSQLLLLIENIQSFDGKNNEASAYNQIFRPKVHEDYILKESDAQAFLYLLKTTRITIPHLLFRVDDPSWPIIKDYSEFLPLQNSDNCVSTLGGLNGTPERQELSGDSKDPEDHSTTKMVTKAKKAR